MKISQSIPIDTLPDIPHTESMSTKKTPPVPISAPEAPTPEPVATLTAELPIDQQALAAKEQYDNLQKQAISALLAQQRDTAAKLAKLGYVVNPVKPIRTGPVPVVNGTRTPCRVCGETGHDARRHRKDNIAAIQKGKRPARK